MYSVWTQDFFKDGTIRQEWHHGSYKTLDEAIKAARSEEDAIIRYCKYDNGNGDFWELLEEATGGCDDYIEYDKDGNEI